MEKIDLLSLTLEELEQEMQAMGAARYRAGQIFPGCMRSKYWISPE